jgi:CelD/BcsL family acetyltransferase involved in cellulose biosynthesis
MTSLEAVPATPETRAAGRDGGMRWTVSAASDLAAVSRAWLSLEMSGIATPYQTLGWQRAAYATLHEGARRCIVCLKDGGGGTAALLPLALERRSGVTIASFPAGKHANYNMGLFSEDAARTLTAADLRTALRAAAEAVGIDLFVLRNQPESWRGVRNPLSLLPRQASTSSAWRADLIPDGDAFVNGLMSSESRKKLRHKERKLGELGPIAYEEAASPERAAQVLAAFLAQKKARFAAIGVSNPFDDAAALRFLDHAAVAALEVGPPAPVSLFSMSAGDRIIAVFGGIVHAGRFSGMFTSFDPDPAAARYSPGDLLLMNLVKMMCARGLRTFDLGAGDAAYKTDYCAIEERLFDSILPITLTGRVAAAAIAGGLAARRLAKRHGALAKPLLRLTGR